MRLEIKLKLLLLQSNKCDPLMQQEGDSHTSFATSCNRILSLLYRDPHPKSKTWSLIRLSCMGAVLRLDEWHLFLFRQDNLIYLYYLLSVIFYRRVLWVDSIPHFYRHCILGFIDSLLLLDFLAVGNTCTQYPITELKSEDRVSSKE